MKLRITTVFWISICLAVLAGQGVPDPARFEKDIQKFEATDKTNPPPQNAIMFYGSSSVRLWKNLAAAFPEHQVINRGFGGSTAPECVAFMDRVVVPHHPSVVLLYAGDNDLAEGRTPEQVAADVDTFVARLRKALPQVKIGFLAIKPSPAREALLEKARTANEMVKAKFEKGEGLFYVDCFTPLLTSDGKTRPELYENDRLHLNERGYGIWAETLRPILDRYSPAEQPSK